MTAMLKPLPLADTRSVERPTATSSSGARLVSLDVFRGLTIAAMLLVNNPGSWSKMYWPLGHADWNGCTPTDLIFPFFLFIVGVAIPFSQAKRSQRQSRREQLLHILTRGLSLILLGILIGAVPAPVPAPAPDGFALLHILPFVAYAFVFAAMFVLLFPWKNQRVSLLLPPIVGALLLLLLVSIHFINKSALASGIPTTHEFGGGMLTPYKLRIPGVLQRIGVCYLIAASIALVAGWRVVIASVVIFCAAYSALMLRVPYPSLVDPNVSVTGKLDKADSLARFVDERVFRAHAYRAYPDPEGLVSTLPSVATVLLGILAGLWLSRIYLDPEYRCAGLMVMGAAVTCVGWALAHALMPLNKPIWTPSYAIYTAGIAMLGLGLCFWFVDILGWRKTTLPLKVYGMNAIAAFVLAGVVGRLMSVFKVPGPDGDVIGLKPYLVGQIERGLVATFGTDSWFANAYNVSLAYALCFVLVFLLLMWILYALKIFVKV